MFENLLCRGFVTVLGAFLITTGVGMMYLWGIISIYSTSYFRIANPEMPLLTEEEANIVFPLTLLGQAISMPLAARFFRKSSPRVVCMITGIIFSTILYLSSYTQQFSTFALIFGLGSGVLIGIIYIIPIAHCHQYFPKKKSSVSAIIISASGIGTFIFAIMAFDTINPNNQPIPQHSFYGNQISSLFPQYLRTLSITVLLLVVGGGLILFDYPSKGQDGKKPETDLMEALINQEFVLETDESEEKHEHKNPFGNMMYEMVYLNKGYEEKTFQNKYKSYGSSNERQFWPSLTINEGESQKHIAHPPFQEVVSSEEPSVQFFHDFNECPRVRDAPKERIFWNIFCCILLSVNLNLLISCNYKNYARMHINDRYLTILGAFGAFACGFSRFLLSGLASAKFSFRKLLWFLLIINCFLAFTIPYISHSTPVYSIYVIVSYICYGGFLGIFPVLSTKIFGRKYGTQIYGLLFYAFPASNFIQLILMNTIEIGYGYWFVFMGSGCMGIAALLVARRVTKTAGEGYDWSERIREHNERKRLLVR